MNKAILTLIVCALAFVPAQAQQVHSHAMQKSGEVKGEVTYSCPMHPSVKAKSKGKCPKCGMDLRPVRNEDKAETDSPQPTVAETAKMDIPDIELLDQNGRKIHFYSDLVKGHTVAINFIFTTCTTICPPLGATFARVQKELGDRMGRDVRLISITVDPATDTPERLKAWGAKFHAGDGWTFVTGDKPQVDELLRALGASSARREDHSPTILIGNDTTGTWTRTYGLAQVNHQHNDDHESRGRRFAGTQVLYRCGTGQSGRQEGTLLHGRAQRQNGRDQCVLHDLHFGVPADESQHGADSTGVG
jgi:cytochrome oxidase Cu insertion factor (SCO1/SenC/PrrC family)